MTQALATIHHDEVLTGEAVALDVQPVGYLMRAIGALIDYLVSLVLLVASLVAIGFGSNLNFELFLDLFRIVIIGLMALVMVVIPTVVETLSRGRSLGKWVVGSRIVRTDGGAIGFRHAFIRALLGFLEIWLTMGALAGLVGAFTPRAQRLGDLVAGTYAERTRTRPLPRPAPSLPPSLAGWAQIADVGRLPDRLARRCAQFIQGAAELQPTARLRIATTLAEEIRPYVSPVPMVDPDTLVRAAVSLRRDREHAGLVLEEERVAQLLAGTTASPRGFPAR